MVNSNAGILTRFARAGVPLVLVVALWGPSAEGRQSSVGKPHEACPDRVVQSGLWTRISPPDFGEFHSPAVEADATRTSSYPGIDTYAVSAAKGRTDVLFVSNGFKVLRSLDQGCNWKEVYSLTDPVGFRRRAARRIASLTVPEADPELLFVLVGDLGSPTVVSAAVSGDFGDTWEAITLPAPTVSQVVVAPSDPRVLYASAGHPGVSPGGYCYRDSAVPGAPVFPWILYRSSDRGQTWELVSPLLQEKLDDRKWCAWKAVTVSPDNPDDLWASHYFGALHSTDGGRTWGWADIGRVNGGVLDEFAISRTLAAHAVTVGSGTPHDRWLFHSEDGGTTWEYLPSPHDVVSVVTSRNGTLFIGTNSFTGGPMLASIHRYDARKNAWTDLVPSVPIDAQSAAYRRLSVVGPKRQALYAVASGSGAGNVLDDTSGPTFLMRFTGQV